MNRTVLMYALWSLAVMTAKAQYTGTAHVSKGLATTVNASMYTCDKGRHAATGRVVTRDGATFMVPASTAWFDSAMPWASDLHNVCEGHTYTTSQQALAALSGDDIVTVDQNGELLTFFLFADNYAEVYVNGRPVGKDRVPYTQFNSSIIRVRVARPFTLAIRAVDWEESLGIGVETNGGDAYHAGDGGLVMVITDSTQRIIATSGGSWRAQTYYTSPIVDLTCPEEVGSVRRSSACATSNIGSHADIYALHWPIPEDWHLESFDDASWPPATVYTPDDVGVMNKPAYTNFLNIFENPSSTASFVWSTNLILDNHVLIRARIDAPTDVAHPDHSDELRIDYDPFTEVVRLVQVADPASAGDYELAVYTRTGQCVRESMSVMSVADLPHGVYVIRATCRGNVVISRMLR